MGDEHLAVQFVLSRWHEVAIAHNLGIPTLISLVKNAKYMLLACLDPIPKVS
jgi:hypothetical protein